jgi:hypothetical protein
MDDESDEEHPIATSHDDALASIFRIPSCTVHPEQKSNMQNIRNQYYVVAPSWFWNALSAERPRSIITWTGNWVRPTLQLPKWSGRREPSKASVAGGTSAGSGTMSKGWGGCHRVEPGH